MYLELVPVFFRCPASCASAGSKSLDHCCHLSNEVLNIDRRQDIPYTLQQVAKLFIVAPNIAHSVGGGGIQAPIQNMVPSELT